MAQTGERAAPRDDDGRHDVRGRRGAVIMGRALPRLLVGVALVAAGCLVKTQPVADGGRTLEGFLVAMAGVYAIVGGIPGAWRATSFLAGIFVAGVVGQLGMTEPLWLQHLRITPATMQGGFNTAFYALAGLQALVVAVFLWTHRAMLSAWLPIRRFAPAKLAALAVVFVACAAHVSRYVDKPHFPAASYSAQLVATAFFVAVNLANLLLVFAAAPEGAVSAVTAWFQRFDLDRRLPRALAVWSLSASLLLGWLALDFVPHIPDEISYVFQAECFARGRLWTEAPPSPESFDVYLVTSKGGRWYATTPPGWPAVLAIGCAVGAPWLVNPLLGAATILIAHALAKRLVGRTEAHLVAALLAASPWFLYLNASFMTHTLSLFLALSAWLALVKARDGADGPRGRTALFGILAGALLGWLALVRQLDAVLFGAVVGASALGLFARRIPIGAILSSAAAFVAVAALIFPFNAAMTGNPFVFPINAYLDELWYPGANRLGFGADVGNPPGWGDLDAFAGHGLRDVLVNTNQNLYTTNVELFGWGVGSLLFAVVHVVFGRKTSTDRLMIALVVTLLLGYHLYWYSGGPDFGARYWYLMIFPLVVLTARGIATTAGFLARGVAGSGAAPRLGVVLTLLAVTTLFVFVPWRAVGRYRDYRGFHADYRTLEIPDRALVFVKSRRNSDFWSAFIRNAPDLRDPRPIFAEDKGDAVNARMIAAFPDRPVVYVEGRSVAGVTRVNPKR